MRARNKRKKGKDKDIKVRSINGVGGRKQCTYSDLHSRSTRVNRNTLSSTEDAKPVVWPRCFDAASSMLQGISCSTTGSVDGNRS